MNTMKLQMDGRNWLTLKGPLFVLKLIPGMYFSQTGKPLKNKIKTIA